MPDPTLPPSTPPTTYAGPDPESLTLPASIADDGARGRLLAELCADQRRRWQAGDRVRAEDYRARHALLRCDAEGMLDLVYNEVVLREELGSPAELAEYVGRFPEFAGQLTHLFEIHRAIESPELLDVTYSLRPEVPEAGLPQLPGYQVLAEVGRGGMGVVYQARQESLNRVVAVKMIRAEGLASATDVARFRAEAETAARLQHPHIVAVHEVGEHAGRHYFSMDYVEGTTLAALIRDHPLPADQAARLVETVARAVHYAHQQGVVHRDLKPANILLNDERRTMNDESGPGLGSSFIVHRSSFSPKITDFGLARWLGSDSNLTTTGAVVGTPSYMAPELTSGTRAVADPAGDVYALGAVLYEALTGRPPFKAATVLETLEQVRTQEPVSPRRLEPGLPRDLETICLKCLEKQPPRRYASALDLAEDVRRYLHHEPILARPLRPWQRAAKWARRRPAWAALVGVSVGALVVLASGGLWYHVRLREALRAAEQGQRRASDNFEQALAAVDRMLLRVGGDRLADVPEAEETRQQLLDDALELYQGFLAAGDNPEPPVRRDIGRAHERLGQIRHALGRKDDAEADYREALAVQEQLVAAFPADRAYQDDLARTCLGLARLAQQTGRLSEAETFARRSQALWERLGDDYADAAVHRADSYETLASVLEASGRSPDAAEVLDHVLALRAAQARARPEQAGLRAALADAQTRRGLVYLRLGQPAQARAAHEQARATWEELVRDYPRSSAYRAGLASCYFQLGQLPGDRGLEDGVLWLGKAIPLFEELCRSRPRSAEFQHDLANCHHARGVAYLARDRVADAEKDFRRAVELQEPLYQARPEFTAYRTDLAASCQNLGLVYQRLSRPADARAAFDKARLALEPFVAEHPDETFAAYTLGAVYTNLGCLSGIVGDAEGVLSWYQRSVAVLEPLVRRDPRRGQFRHALANAYGGRATALSARGRHAEAVPDWDRLLELYEGDQRDQYRLWRAINLIDAGDHARAAQALQDWAAEPGCRGEDLLTLASVYVRCPAKVLQDSRLSAAERIRAAERYTLGALDVLRKACSAGDLPTPVLVNRLATDRAFDPLRPRREFQDLLAELKQPATPGK